MKPAQQISPRVWRLGNHNFACFLIGSGAEYALFEVGISVTSPLLLAQLKALGVDPKQVTHLVVSHSHGDHATGQAALALEMPAASLVMTAASRRHLEKPETSSGFAQEDQFTRQVLCREDPWLAQQASCPPLPLLPLPIQTVEAGQSLSMGGTQVSFLEARGHAPGGLVAWLPEEGVLLASDSAGFPMTGGMDYPLYFVSWSDYMETIRLMARLEPQVVGLGHQGWYQGPAARKHLAGQEEHLTRFHESILAAGPERAASLPREIFEQYYHHELAIYEPGVIMECCQLLVQRSLAEA